MSEANGEGGLDRVKLLVRGLYALLNTYHEQKLVNVEIQAYIGQMAAWMDEGSMSNEGLAKTLAGLGDNLATDLVGLAMLGLESCKAKETES